MDTIQEIENKIQEFEEKARNETNIDIKQRYKEWIEFHKKRLPKKSKQP